MTKLISRSVRSGRSVRSAALPLCRFAALPLLCYTGWGVWGCGEMADAHALGACAARRVGSSPTVPTKLLCTETNNT